MKEGYVLKGFQEDEKQRDDLKLINNYSRSKLNAEDVYIFSVVLCDNDIDRDFECFSVESLYKLADLFVGKTGIMDHDAKSENQKARIFDCYVEKVEGKISKIGTDYHRLVAKAYVPRIEKNNDFILEIDTGIRKEVSVGCAVMNNVCSICGTNLKTSCCVHQKRKTYEVNGEEKLCYSILEDPIDAYEWSFVAVPAQVEAGVIKHKTNTEVKTGTSDIASIKKRFKSGEQLKLTAGQSRRFGEYIKTLEMLADIGKAYKKKLEKDVVSLISLVTPELEASVCKAVVKRMSFEELQAFCKAFSKESKNMFMPKPQLMKNKEDASADIQNTQFKI